MNRRELLKMITVATGTALIGGNSLFAFSALDDSEHDFGVEDIQRLDALAETILPRTDTPGAKQQGKGQKGKSGQGGKEPGGEEGDANSDEGAEAEGKDPASSSDSPSRT